MDGILLIHKEQNMTSHDVVAQLRKILHIKKIGHSGTLDPNATGVLLVLIGKACKALPFLADTDKEYVAEMMLGKQTISDDIWGEVQQEKEVVPIHDFQGVLNSFLGEQIQVPPMVSSVRVQGKKLYEYAREGIAVERPKRKVMIYDIEVLDEDKLKFRVACSSGTYVRSLCHDIAEKTGNVGCMSSLVRTKVGRFTLDQCVRLQDVKEGNFTLHPINEVLRHLPFVEAMNIQDVLHGKRILLDCEEERVVMVDQQGQAMAIYEREEGSRYRCLRGLW